MIEKEREDEIMLNNNNVSTGGRNMLPAFIINSEGTNIARPTIASLEDADKFVSERIGTDGTFSCYLGEEILIRDGAYNDIWQVVGVDTELDKGDIALTQHHITLVPKAIIDVSKIHSSNADCHGYANSDMYTKTIPNIVTHLEKVLGDHLLERRVKLSNATSDNTSPNAYMSSDNGYYSVKANLLCQMQVFGTVNSNYGNAYDTGDDTTQLPGFATGKVAKASDSWYWLRDVYGYTSDGYYRFSGVDTYGSLRDLGVNDSRGGVRPLITVG
jgi:hypothetical protein